MAAEVEVHAGEVGRSLAGGRLHLSPLTDSNNKNLLEISTMNQSHIISPEPSKPVPGPKPRLTPKPFTVERNTTIKPILAPKPQPKPRPESTRLSGYKPDLSSNPKPQQPPATSKPGPASTNSSRPASTSFKTSKLNAGQTTKPVVQPFKPAPPLAGDPGKPISPVPAGRPKPPYLTYSGSLRRPPSAEWSGSTKKEERDLESPSKVGTSITRAKSMGYLLQIGQEEEEKPKSDAAVPLRPQPRGIRPRPVSAIFPTTPTKTDSPNPALSRSERRPLSADLTSKFESIGLSLHRKTPKAKENTPEDKVPPQKKEQEKSIKTITLQNTDAATNKAAASDQCSHTKDNVSAKDSENVPGVSIKSRISLLLDSSTSPVTPAPGQAQETIIQSGHEAEPAVGVKELIKQLTVDTTPNQSPVSKPALKPRPLPLDLTKRFSPDPGVSLSEAADRHDTSKAPQKRSEDAANTPSDLKTFLDLKDSQDQKKKPVSEGSDSLFSPKESDLQTVRASLFENVVEKRSVLMVDENKSENEDLSSPLLDKPDEEGKLVTATYKEPASPSGPVHVMHSFDTVPAAEGSTVVSESVPSAQWEDKAMTLRLRRSEGTKTTPEKTSPEPVSTAPRYLRVGALPKWNIDFNHETDLETEMPKDKPRESELEDASASAKRFKTQQTEEQAKPRATYFALTGQMQETVTATSDTGENMPFGDRSLQWNSQGKVLPFRRNPSLDEAFGKTSEGNADSISSKVERETQKLEMERQAEMEFARLKEREMQREFERQRQKAFEKEKQEMEEKQRGLDIQKQIELERQKHLEFEKQRQLELRKQKQQEIERQKQMELERQKQNELERQKLIEIERQRQVELERQRQTEMEKQRQIEHEKQRQLEIKKQKQELERQKQMEIERQKQLELEKQRQIEVQRQKQLEAEKQRQLELERQKQIDLDRQQQLELERRRQIEIERQKQIELEKQRQVELEKQRQMEAERQKERERQKQIELEKQRHIELERQKLQETERAKQMELEKERQRQLERERRELEKQRQREEERRQTELDKERKLMEKQMERQKMQAEAEEQERKQQLELQKKRERQQVLELEKQRLREKIEREQAEKLRQMALEQEMLRLRELDKERERQKELEREMQREQELQRQRELERERQKQLDMEGQELEKQRIRQQEQEKERLKKEELERIKEMERRQLLEFEKQRQAERQQILELEKRRLREKIEREEAEKMRQVAKHQEAERLRLKEKQKKEEQERIRLESAALRPKVVDLDTVLRNDQPTKASPRSDVSTRWREPSPKTEQTFRPGILDIDSFTSQNQPSPSRDLFPVVGIQEVGPRIQMPPQNSGGMQSPVWTTSSQDPWELRSVEMSVDKPEPARKQQSKTSPEHLLLRQEERRQANQRCWSSLVDDPFQMGPFSGLETKPAGSTVPADQVWLPRDPPIQGQSRAEGPSQRRTQGSQELSRIRSRSMNRRSAPSSSAVESSLSRMRSRSAHRDQARDSWVQQKQNASPEDESKDSETPVHETDSQYGTWETGLRSEDSLTPATPSSESNLSPSPRKPTSPQTPVDHTPHMDTDTADDVPPPSSSESQPLPFPDIPVTLLDSSALRSRPQLVKKRAPRTRPSRAAKTTAGEADEGASDNWIYKDSTEEKVESKKEDSDSEEKVKGADAGPAVASQPQRVALFPGMDPSALMAQLKKRGEADNQTEGLNPAPSQLSRSPKSPFLPRAARVLPPPGGKENSEENSPQWLKELKSKKRLSQYENES